MSTLRTPVIALSLLAVSLAALAACGGGGGSSSAPTAPTAPAPAVSGTPMANQTVNNFTGPSSQVTVSIKVPPRTAPSPGLDAALRAKFGAKKTNSHLRVIYNTSPTASIRAAGYQQHEYAGRLQQSTGRDPTFISGATTFMEFVLSTGSNVLVDDTSSCTSESCTATFTVPVGTGFTATLYLYDDCGFLIAAGSVNNVSVTTGTNSPLTITLNGVVAYLDLNTTASTPFLADPSGAQVFTVTPVAYDWDDDIITTPGVLLDSNFNQITGVTITPPGGDVTPATPATVTPNPDLSFPSTTYDFAGTNSSFPLPGTTLTWSTTVNVGSQLVPTFYTQGYPSGTNAGSLQISDNLPTLIWTNPLNYPQNPGTDPVVQVDNGISYGGAYPNGIPVTNAFVPQVNTNTYEFGLSESIGAYAGNVTITDNGSCGGILTYPTSATPFSTFASSPYVQVTMTNTVPNDQCVLYATDAAGRAGELVFVVNNSTLTIQNKARSK